MSGLEAVVAAAGKAVAGRAIREGLAVRAAKAERSADLVTLIQSGFPDRFVRRSFERQLEAVADGVERRLTVLVEQEYGGLTENDRSAVLHEVVATVKGVDLSDKALMAADMDAIKLAKDLRAGLPDPARQLGEAGARLYDVLLDECLDCLVRIVQQLPQYLPRVTTEILGRVSSVEDQVAALGQQISSALGRLPARSLDAPSGTQDDGEFERRYLEHLSLTLDEVELFGVRVENYRPRATLSVAYISLSVSAEGGDRHRAPERMRFADLTEMTAHREAITLRVERALGQSRRVLLRGEAGTGKSTLLRWLSVTAARSGFSGDLAEWNGSVPFIVKLRSHPSGDLPGPEGFLADVAGPVAGRMPDGWVHRVLDSGRALLLVDGVDELAVRHRPAVRQWLNGLLSAHPGTRTVVTSRPAAADARWLTEEGFSSVTLEPMTPVDLRELVRQWHVAMRGSKSLPCEPEDLDEYEGALLARFESSPHLQVLASTPLLAAMLCALNLDRSKQLPRNRMGLYAAALELLLERRDAERGITAEVMLEPEQKIRVLQDLAGQLAVWGRSELSRTTALKRVGEKIRTMPRLDASAETVLDHLLQRSGVIREPIPGRIDFVHRTVQEYLAAKQAADDADMEPLIERAHLDQWRETVVMAAGHANAPLRQELLSGLLDRIDEGGRHTRRLRLLVAGCLETIQELPLDLHDRIEACLTLVIPPRNMAEAKVLALAGEEILRRLPDDLQGISEAKAVATVQTCWLINGDAALGKLAAYAHGAQLNVQDELVRGWSYFDPDSYAREVIAHADWYKERLWISNPRLAHSLRHLPELSSFSLFGDITQANLSAITGIFSMRHLTLYFSKGVSSVELVLPPRLESLYVKVGEFRRLDCSPLAELERLFFLGLPGVDHEGDVGFLRSLAALSYLEIEEIGKIYDLAPIAGLAGLQELSLHNCLGFDDPGFFGNFPLLESLLLEEADIKGGLSALVDNCPGLKDLRIVGGEWSRDLNPLDGLTLTALTLDRTGVTDLAAVARQPHIESLTINESEVSDLSPLEQLPELRMVDLQGTSSVMDVAPLRGKPDLLVVVGADQEVRNAHLLHRSARIQKG